MQPGDRAPDRMSVGGHLAYLGEGEAAGDQQLGELFAGRVRQRQGLRPGSWWLGDGPAAVMGGAGARPGWRCRRLSGWMRHA
jgi:hypothetical protein